MFREHYRHFEVEPYKLDSLTLIVLYMIIVFCSLHFVFLEIAKKSLNLFNVFLGTKSKMIKHPVAGIVDNLLKNFALAVVSFL